MDKHFHIEQNFGVFYGTLDHNASHRHFASQVSICHKGSLKLDINDYESDTDAVYIPSQMKHRLTSTDQQLSILVNPLSILGMSLEQIHIDKSSRNLHTDLKIRLSNAVARYTASDIVFDELIQQVKGIMQVVSTNHVVTESMDSRVYDALIYLDREHDRVISIDEIASVCHLSSSRFLHLFKEHTKVSFRRYQIWNRIVKSLSNLEYNNISNTAHLSGFADSSHYARSIKETFGITPKFFIK